MTTIIPKSGQFRFYGEDRGEIDFVNIFPKMDLKELNEYYQRGVYPVNYYPDVAINNEIQIQIITDKTISGSTWVGGVPTVGGDLSLINKITGETKIFKFQNVTPSGWLAPDFVLVAKAKIEKEGLYYFKIRALQKLDGNVSTLISDPFYAKNWAKDKDMLRITYFDPENRNGGIYFSDETTKIWEPTTFYTGNIIQDGADYDLNEFTDEGGNSYNTSTTPTATAVMTITNIHASYIENLSYQLACEFLYVNSDRFNFKSWSLEKIDNTEIYNITINLSRNDNNNFQQIN